jgi:hypothetical protein
MVAHKIKEKEYLLCLYQKEEVAYGNISQSKGSDIEY